MTTPASAPRYVAYYRVSTQKQGRSGLGLEAQKAAVKEYVERNGGILLSPLEGDSNGYEETESGKRADRPKLMKALERCKFAHATLCVARLDRLTRDVSFLCKLRDSGVDFVAVDNAHATPLTITILIAVAEEERKLISARTKAALQAAKARGVQLGCPKGQGVARFGANAGKGGAEATKAKADAFAQSLASIVLPLKAEGLSLRQIAAKLNADHIDTAKGKPWQANSVKRLLNRLGA